MSFLLPPDPQASLQPWHPLVELRGHETEALMAWALAVGESDATWFEISQQLARRLGAHPRLDGLTEIGFWVPELANQILPAERNIYLEIFTPLEKVDFSETEQKISFRYECVDLRLQGEFVWGVLSGMVAGDRDRLGSLYWLRYSIRTGRRWFGWKTIGAGYPITHTVT